MRHPQESLGPSLWRLDEALAVGVFADALENGPTGGLHSSDLGVVRRRSRRGRCSNYSFGSIHGGRHGRRRGRTRRRKGRVRGIRYRHGLVDSVLFALFVVDVVNISSDSFIGSMEHPRSSRLAGLANADLIVLETAADGRGNVLWDGRLRRGVGNQGRRHAKAKAS